MARYIDANLAKAQFTSNFESLYDKPTIWAFIDDVPTADVQEVQHGKWIEHEDDWYGNYYECSNCHDEFCLIEGYMYYKICPSCGAKMDLEGGMKE